MLRFRKVHSDFLLRQDLHFPFLELRQLAALGGIGEDQPLGHRLLQAVVQQCMDTANYSGAETFVLEFRKIFALNPSALLEAVVKSLDLNGGQLVQWDAANSGDDVVLDIVGVVGFRIWPDARFNVDLVPRPYPRCHCVSPGFGYVQPLTFADCGFEFLLDLGLSFTQHVLDDPFSCLRVIARGVPPLPSAILSFSDVSLAVCSSFRHRISLLCNGKPYRKKQEKATEKRNRYQKVIICSSEPRRRIFVYCGANLALPEILFIDYSGAKYTHFTPEIAAAQNHFFVWLKTENFSNACGMVTLKSPMSRAFSVPDVHQKPQKRPPRCTLDCGFKTSESPALRGFVAGPQALATAVLYLVLKSNGFHHSENLPVKFGFSSKSVPANIVKKLRPQRCPQPFLIPLFNFSHKRPTVAFTGKSGYTLGFAQRIAHSGSQGETGAFRTGVVSLPSDRSARFGNPVWPGLKTADFAAFGSWSGVLSKNAESLRDSDALMCVAVPRRRGPAGLRNSVVRLLMLCAFSARAIQPSASDHHHSNCS